MKKLRADWTHEMLADPIVQGDTKKTGTFEKPNKNLRNPRKKKLLTEIEPL